MITSTVSPSRLAREREDRVTGNHLGHVDIDIRTSPKVHLTGMFPGCGPCCRSHTWPTTSFWPRCLHIRIVVVQSHVSLDCDPVHSGHALRYLASRMYVLKHKFDFAYCISLDQHPRLNKNRLHFLLLEPNPASALAWAASCLRCRSARHVHAQTSARQQFLDR